MNTNNPSVNKNIAALTALGQSVWLDYITRDLVRKGGLKKLIDNDGLRGMTSNPTIFQKAIASGTMYDEQVGQLANKSASDIFEAIAVQDIQEACDVFRPVYDSTGGLDGYVSIEVQPGLAHDTNGTIEEARRLWREVNRPNVMVKVPGTAEGAPAIRQLLSEGININITLLFSLQNHERVMWAYIEALEQRIAAGQPIDKLRSVASYFVSRVDTLVDKQLDGKIKASSDAAEQERLRGLFGKTAIANAQLAYARFREIFDGDRFTKLKANGAHVQRPLWASTSTKNPAYRDVMYIEQLIGPDTVNTIPQETLEAFEDHGLVARTVDQNIDAARKVLADLKAVGIDYDAVTKQLEDEGVQKFSESFADLLADVDKKCQAIKQAAH